MLSSVSRLLSSSSPSSFVCLRCRCRFPGVARRPPPPRAQPRMLFSTSIFCTAQSRHAPFTPPTPVYTRVSTPDVFPLETDKQLTPKQRRLRVRAKRAVRDAVRKAEKRERGKAEKRERGKATVERRAAERSGLTPQKVYVRDDWTACGLRPQLADVLRDAFPDIEGPTETQRSLLKPLADGYSVLVRGTPASGKSFLAALWLLSLSRAENPVDGALSTTALVLVPTRELAEQYYDQIRTMLDATGSKPLTRRPTAFVQALYRGSAEEEKEQLKRLNDSPRPHIVITTPTRMLDLLSSKDKNERELLDIESLQALVVDEVDAALLSYLDERETISKGKPPPEPLMVLLDYIFRARKATAMANGTRPLQPQLAFMCSAVQTRKMKNVIVKQHKGWLGGENMPGFSPSKRASCKVHHVNIPLYLPQGISHSVVRYDVKAGTFYDVVPSGPPDMRASAEEKQKQKPQSIQTFSAAVAAAATAKLIAVDNYPSHVLACLGPEDSQTSFKDELAKYGIEARVLRYDSWKDATTTAPSSDLAEDDKTIVWMTNSFRCRGLDLPGLMHAYILHPMQHVREYVTYSGRVGPGGKMVSVFLSDSTESGPLYRIYQFMFRKRKHRFASYLTPLGGAKGVGPGVGEGMGSGQTGPGKASSVEAELGDGDSVDGGVDGIMETKDTPELAEGIGGTTQLNDAPEQTEEQPAEAKAVEGAKKLPYGATEDQSAQVRADGPGGAVHSSATATKLEQTPAEHETGPEALDNEDIEQFEHAKSNPEVDYPAYGLPKSKPVNQYVNELQEAVFGKLAEQRSATAAAIQRASKAAAGKRAAKVAAAQRLADEAALEYEHYKRMLRNRPKSKERRRSEKKRWLRALAARDEAMSVAKEGTRKEKAKVPAAWW